MPPSSSDESHGQITRLLLEHRKGDPEALESLFPLVYEDLRRIARRQLRTERRGHTLNATALVHEAYINLVDNEDVEWRDRAHFFAIASRAMRHLLIDYARRRKAKKRGGERVRVTLHSEMASTEEQTEELLALEEALSALDAHDPRMVRVVECRFFGGMTVPETAEALNVSVRTVERSWTRAKAYLYQALAPKDA